MDQKDEKIYIMMEHMSGGSISSMLSQYGKFDETLIQRFVKQIVAGLEYLHQQGVAHCDVKGGNILSDGEGNVKLADFGASKHLENLPLLSSSGSEINKSIRGSLYWMAPELINQEGYSRRCDVWSLGCTIIEMASGKHPWPDCKNLTEFVCEMMEKKIPPIPEHLSKNCKDFIKICCTFDKNKRVRTYQLKSLPFLKTK